MRKWRTIGKIFAVAMICLMIGPMMGDLGGVAEAQAAPVADIIDSELLFLIDQYASDSDYFNEEWNLTIDQYKAWIATIAWAEGGGNYNAHSQSGRYMQEDLLGDRFDHVDVGSQFRFSTGIGPFQLDPIVSTWPTIWKLNPKKALLLVLIWHLDNKGSGATLLDFSEGSPWLAVRPGKIESRWQQVTNTDWDDHKGGPAPIEWDSEIRPRINEEDPFEQSVRYIGQASWDATFTTDTTEPEERVVLQGHFPTWLIAARGFGGTPLYSYYYTYSKGVWVHDESTNTAIYNPNMGCEVWVWDNSGQADEFRYIFVREYTAGRFPEHRTHEGGYWNGNYYIARAGITLNGPALNPSDLQSEEITDGLKWLRENQNMNGSWTYSGRITQQNVGLTSLAAACFLNHGLNDEDDLDVLQAINWILEQQNTDGSITTGPYYVYDTSLAILALCAAQNPDYDDEIEQAAHYLVDIQNDVGTGYTESDRYYGGWSYWPDYHWADLSNSQFALLALHYAESMNPDDTLVPQDTWDNAEIFVQRCQNREVSNPDWNFYDDGGFIYLPGSTIWGGGQSYASISMGGLWGFYATGESRDDPRVQDAISWLENHYYVNQNYPLGTQFLYYYLYGLSKAYVIWDIETINGHDWYQEMTEELVSRQMPDGHWPGTDANEEPDNVATCWAILALETKLIPPGTALQVNIDSPADLHVYDPEGRHVGINYDTSEVEIEIPGATYSGPGSEPQVIHIPDPVAGTYDITLIGTATGDFALTIEGLVGTDVVSTVTYTNCIHPGQVYSSTATVSAIAGAITIDTTEPETEVIPAEIDIDPNTVSVAGKGKWITCYIELPPGYDVSQIDIASIRLNGTVPALGKPTEIGDYDNDGLPDLMVKFHRTAVQDALAVGEEVEVTITGVVNGIIFEGSDTIRVIITGAPPGLAEWTRVSTPSEESWVLAPDSVIVDYAVADGGEVAYASMYSYDTGEFHLLKSDDHAATWEDITDAVEDVLDDNDYINYLLRVATDNVDPNFVAVALVWYDFSTSDYYLHVFISDDGGTTFRDADEVEEGGVYLVEVSELAVSPEVNGIRDIAIGGMDNYGDSAIFHCRAIGDIATNWENATEYDGWDDDGAFTSLAVVDIHFAPSWIVDKTILVVSVADSGPYDVYLQSGTWGTTYQTWNEEADFEKAVPIIEDVEFPEVIGSMFDVRGIAGITVPLDYSGRNSDSRYVWVWVNYYDYGEPAGTIFRVKDDSVNTIDWQIEDEELWLTNVSYLGYISEGKAIAGVLGDGIGGLTECCEGVQIYRNDCIANMDICCCDWEQACKPPTGVAAMEAFYVSDDPASVKAYAVALWGLDDYDEGAWSVSFDDGNDWNQLSLVDTHIDYLSDVAVSPDCNKTMLVAINNLYGCECDSVWLHAENLPEAEEYSGKWLRTWCGELENDWGLLRLAPEETNGETVYLVDRWSDNMYWNEMETLVCWECGCATVDNIVDLAVKDKETIYALDGCGIVAMSDDYALGWHEPVDSEIEEGYTIVVRDDDILVGSEDGDVSHSDDGGESFNELEKVAVAGYVTVAFDSYFDRNNTIYVALANAGDDNGIYRWVIGESTQWENLGAEDYDYTGLVLDRASCSKPKTSPDTGGVLYASYISGDATGVARCLTPAKDACCDGTDWDYLTKGLTSELFAMTPQALKICGCLTPGSNSKLFAVDGSEPYDTEKAQTGTVWSFED